MPTEPMPNDPRALWQSQPAAPFRLSAEDLRQRTARLERDARRRTLAGYGVCAFEAVAFLAVAAFARHPLMRAGALLLVAACAFHAYQFRALQLARRAEAAARDEATASLAFYRSELERQRDFQRGMWLWSRIFVLVPGGCVFFVGFALAYPSLAPFIYAELAAFLLIVPVGVPLQLRRAGRYQRQLDELDEFDALDALDALQRTT
jgi:hypothetical protein